MCSRLSVVGGGRTLPAWLEQADSRGRAPMTTNDSDPDKRAGTDEDRVRTDGGLATDHDRLRGDSDGDE